MASDRYVLLGLARARSEWFRAVAQWSTAASIPAEFTKCLSSEELRARLTSTRAYSAVLVDADHPSLDRDLVEAARSADVRMIGVGTWPSSELGLTAVLPSDFDRDALVETLVSHCRRIGRGDSSPMLPTELPFTPWRGRLFAVCGPGGTGASTVAIALAQASAAGPRANDRVVLADFALRAEQGMLHDCLEVTPCVQELVEAHRTRTPSEDEVRATTYFVEARHYQLLLGVRQPRFWPAIRPRAFDAALESLRSVFQVVVADVDADLEGEGDGGSIDVQERHHMARSVTALADTVLAVGRPGMKGVHSLAGVIVDLLGHGVSPTRILPVINCGPKHPGARAQTTRLLAGLTAGGPGAEGLSGPVFLPERHVDEALRDGVALPPALTQPLAGAVDALLERQLDAAPPILEPVLVTPGSLGHWDDDELAVGGAELE